MKSLVLVLGTRRHFCGFVSGFEIVSHLKRALIIPLIKMLFMFRSFCSGQKFFDIRGKIIHTSSEKCLTLLCRVDASSINTAFVGMRMI